MCRRDHPVALALQRPDHVAVLELPRRPRHPVALEAADGRVPGHVPRHGVLGRGDLLLHRAADVLRSAAGVFLVVWKCFFLLCFAW